MKSRINNLNANITVLLSIVALIGVFGFSIPKAITRPEYDLNNLETENTIERLRDRLENIEVELVDLRKDCHSLRTRQMYLQSEKIKWQSYEETYVESTVNNGALVTHQRASLALANITQNLADINRKLQNQDCE